MFGQKLLNTQAVWAGVLSIAHKEMGKHTERVFRKNSLKPNAASYNNASWCTDTNGFLEHSPSGGSLCYKGPTLQKIPPVFGGDPPSYSWEEIRCTDCQCGALSINEHKEQGSMLLRLQKLLGYFCQVSGLGEVSPGLWESRPGKYLLLTTGNST